jgi:hypothetical protein
MTGRTPACEDSAAIAARLAEIQRARMQAIAGCSCPQRDTNGNVVHTPLCPLRAEPASQMEMAREAIIRARERQRRTADDYIAEGIAAKYARHRVLS